MSASDKKPPTSIPSDFAAELQKRGLQWRGYGQMPGATPQGLAKALQDRKAAETAGTAPKASWGTPERPVSIAICIPSYQDRKFEFDLALEKLYTPRLANSPIYGVTHRLDAHGLLVEDARNLLVADALRADSFPITHVLFVDDDMVFAPDALMRLLAHDLPIVGGLCFNRRPPAFQPILMRYHHPSWGMNDKRYGFVYDYPDNSLFEVDATGGAFLLVKREVFETLNASGHENKWFDRMRGISEDFSFCERVKNAGFQIFVDTGTKIGHLTRLIVDEQFAKSHRQFEHDPWMGTPKPRVEGEAQCSVTIPVFNQDISILKAAVLSVMNQTVPCEVVVVDDGSFDPPLNEAFEKWLVDTCGEGRGKLLHHRKNMGISEALNTGIKDLLSREDGPAWWAWLSSDDMFLPEKTEKQLKALSAWKAKASFTQWQAIHNDGEGFAGYSHAYSWSSIPEQMAYLSQGCVINGSTVMVHRDMFMKLGMGMFDPSFLYSQDWDFWCRIGICHLWVPVHEILVTRREFGNLTEKISKDPTLQQRRDHEDSRVRGAYEAYLPGHREARRAREEAAKAAKEAEKPPAVICDVCKETFLVVAEGETHDAARARCNVLGWRCDIDKKYDVCPACVAKGK